jgi:hypothetical protein
LRAEATQLPAPREFSRKQIDAWIADDEAGMRRLSPRTGLTANKSKA